MRTLEEIEKQFERATSSYDRAHWAETWGLKLLHIARSAQECLDRQTDYQARWAMEDIAKALKELEE